MTTLQTGDLSSSDLVPMLRAWAAGAYADEAAVELVIAHNVWLRRRDFRTALIDAVDDGWTREGTIQPMATIVWSGVEAFLAEAPSSSSEMGMLRIAALLAGERIPHSIAEVTAGLDELNAILVLDALAHRFGWQERGTRRTVSGVVGGAS